MFLLVRIAIERVRAGGVDTRVGHVPSVRVALRCFGVDLLQVMFPQLIRGLLPLTSLKGGSLPPPVLGRLFHMGLF